MRSWTIAILSALLGAAALARATVTPPKPALGTVAHVNLDRYLGKWYEFARYPNRFERSCERDVTAEYSLRRDGQIRVVNSCLTSNGRQKQSVGSAVVVDKETNAKLKVTFFWPFYGKYWIIDLGENYEYAVVGEPSRTYLWVLSRTPTIADTTFEAILGRIAQQGYDASKLVRTTQTASASR